MIQVLSGRYEQYERATQAVWALHGAGLALSSIALVTLRMQPTPDRVPTALRLAAVPFEAQTWWEGFLEALLCQPLTTDALRDYTDVVRSGASLILVHGTASQVTTTRRVLEETGAADIHLRVMATADLTPTPLPVPANPLER